MPSSARILPFPAKALQRQDAGRVAVSYAQSIFAGERPDSRELILENADALMALLPLLRDGVASNPAPIAEEAKALYRDLGASSNSWSFDERDYFLGETALIAGTAFRVLGERSAAEIWFDRAEASFRNTVNPSPVLANVTYQRLALRCEIGRHDEVIELVPLLASTFDRLRMLKERTKCVLLEALALKQAGRRETAAEKFLSVADMGNGLAYPELSGTALTHLADIHAADGADDQASECYQRALPLLQAAGKPAAVAHLKGVVGEVLQRQGKIGAAIAAYRESIADYESLGMKTWVAYLRLVLAQALLAAARSREAEWQVLAALPTIDEEKMLPEGLAAIGLLRESIRAKKLDAGALSNVRELLKTS